LNSAQLRSLRTAAPPTLKKPLDRVQRRWTRLVKEATEPYTVLDEPPQAFASALQDATAAISQHLADSPTSADGALLQFYFDALQFTRLLDTYGTHSLFDVTRDAATGPRARHDGSTLCIRNVVPAPFQKPRFAGARSAVLFSATLAPWDFYTDTLGLPQDTAWLDVAAPFQAEQLTVHIARDVSTRFQHRSSSLAPIAQLIAAQYDAAPGNYIAFFSSFDYLEQAMCEFCARHPQIPIWQQGRRMSEFERDAFVARFASNGTRLWVRQFGSPGLDACYAIAVYLSEVSNHHIYHYLYHPPPPQKKKQKTKKEIKKNKRTKKRPHPPQKT
jgi:Rad3-related DNA helicase